MSSSDQLCDNVEQKASKSLGGEALPVGRKEKKKENKFCLRPPTPKHIMGGWSNHIDSSELVIAYGEQNMVTTQFGIRTSDLSITGPAR
jgi:hypothetical protein